MVASNTTEIEERRLDGSPFFEALVNHRRHPLRGLVLFLSPVSTGSRTHPWLYAAALFRVAHRHWETIEESEGWKETMLCPRPSPEF